MDLRALSLLSIFFLTAWSPPHRIAHNDFRASLRVRPIILDTNSPAFAAAEDIHQNINQEVDHQNIFLKAHGSVIAINVQPLKIGQRFKWPVAENKKPITLAPIVISRATKVDHVQALIASVNEKPAAEVSVKDYAEILVKEELQRRHSAGTEPVREVVSSTGNHILIAAPSALAAAAAATKVTTAKKTEAPLPRLARNENIKLPTVIANNTKPARAASSPTVASLPLAIKPPTITAADIEVGEYEITGPLMFIKGAALISGRQALAVYHEVAGYRESVGAVNIPEASYRITTKNLEGQLIAEVRTRDGQLLSSARADLNEVADKFGHAKRIKNIQLAIEPAFGGLQAEVLAADEVGGKKFLIADAKLQIEGVGREIIFKKSKKMFTDETLTTPSDYVARATHGKFWPTISIGQSGEAATIHMMPNKLVEALLSLTLDKYSAREALNLGLVWGRVLMGDKPISGAQVRVVGEVDKKPTYINGYLPEAERKSTATSGVYAFSMLEPGEKMIRVNLGEKLFWPVLVPIESKTVTYTDLKIQPRRNIVFSSREAFTEIPKVAQVNPLGTDEKFFIPDGGRMQMSADTINGLTYLEAYSDDFHPATRTGLRPNQSEVNFTFVTKAWLKLAREHLGLSEAPGTGNAIIYLSGDEFDVTLGAGSELRDKNIVYFDSTGKFLDQPVDDGGVIILNVPRGFQTVIVIPQKAKKILTRLIYFDEYALASENLSLMY